MRRLRPWEFHLYTRHLSIAPHPGAGSPRFESELTGTLHLTRRIPERSKGVARVILETSNPLDLSVEELEELARQLRALDGELTVSVGMQEQRGAGVTFWDVLHFWIPEPEFMRDALYGYLIAQCQQALSARRKRKHQSNRPSSIIVHLPDGTVVDVINDGDHAQEGLPDRPARPQPRIIEQSPEDPDSGGSGG